jgi:diguanylate cyclase (GGDEF)-like protein
VDFDELARRRALACGHPSALGGDGDVQAPPGLVRDRSAVSLVVLQRRVTQAEHRLRDLARRMPVVHAQGGSAELDRLRAAEDRLEAARDRLEAATALQRAYRDRLTGALQRDAGWDRLEHELARARRERSPLVVAFVDLDGLKRLNDTAGHAAGDRALRAVGQALAGGLRRYDVIVRFGGDEFVCGLPGVSLDEARRRFVEVARALDLLHTGARISVGLALSRRDDVLDAVLRRADSDLYAGRARRPPTPVEPRRPVTGIEL